MKNPIYVTGHKNPDTDSIVSSIAYAEFKRKQGYNVVAGRVGPVRSDTEYLLERFEFEDPLHLYTAKCTIREIEYDQAVVVSKDITIREALNKLIKTASKTVFVTKNNRLEGVVSLSNLNELWTANSRYLAKVMKTVTFDNIMKTLKGTVYYKADYFKVSGNVEMAPTSDKEVHEGDIVITASERAVKQALKAQVGLIIIIGHFDIFESEEYLRLFEDANVNVIKTDLDAMKISKLLFTNRPLS